MRVVSASMERTSEKRLSGTAPRWQTKSLLWLPEFFGFPIFSRSSHLNCLISKGSIYLHPMCFDKLQHRQKGSHLLGTLRFPPQTGYSKKACPPSTVYAEQRQSEKKLRRSDAPRYLQTHWAWEADAVSLCLSRSGMPAKAPADHANGGTCDPAPSPPGTNKAVKGKLLAQPGRHLLTSLIFQQPANQLPLDFLRLLMLGKKRRRISSRLAGPPFPGIRWKRPYPAPAWH